MIYFSADYGDRDKLLRLGAEWDFSSWKWRVPAADAAKFSQWINGDIIALDSLYIAEGVAVCPECGALVKVAVPAFNKYTELVSLKTYGEEEYNFLYGLENIDGKIADVLRANFPVKKRYVEGYGYRYLTNGCPACDTPFPDAYLFGDESSPFCADVPEKAAALKFYKLYGGRDTALCGRVGRSCNKKLIEENSRFSGAEQLK